MNTIPLHRGQPGARLFTILSLLTLLLCAATLPSHAAGTLKVMPQGLGSGTIAATAGSVINCGAVCDEVFAGSPVVTLQATAAAGSTFDKWSGDCAAVVVPTCNITMSANRSVRASFRLNPDVPPLVGAPTPGNIQTYLDTNPTVDTAAEFLRALPEEYRKGWILMTRSESLQTGTAKYPRILLPSANSQYVFTLGLAPHASYPGSHPNAIEFMEYDTTEKNFRFHEIVLAHIDAMGRVNQFPVRERGVSVDEQRCTRCHSTRNIRNPDPGDFGTTGVPPSVGLVKWKNKPNWETYDSWAGMLPFNRDTIFPGSVEAAALRKLLNPWTWRTDVLGQQVMEQLALQSNGPGELPVYPAGHVFTRIDGGTNDGHIQFAFDVGVVTSEPAPVGGVTGPINYAFDGLPGAGPGTNINRDPTAPVILHAYASPLSGEGRGVQLFDQIAGLDGNFNQTRVGNELANHRFATGGVRLDARPLALAINRGCIVTDSAGNISTTGGAPAFTGSLAFFNARHGVTGLADIIDDTSLRSRDLTRRKADIQKFNLDRTGDNYLLDSDMTPDIDLIELYGPFTSFGDSTSLTRLRQEIFRRPFGNDTSIMGGSFYVDRELYGSNTNKVSLFRYLLEPLGVSVDKWSVNVRGRSRSYTFADVFGTYTTPITSELEASLTADPHGSLAAPYTCPDLVAAANAELAARLPAASDVPRYTDVQRIFNKSCIECHGGLDYPPFAKYSTDPTIFDLSERENPPTNDRLWDSHQTLNDLGMIGVDAASSYIFQRITAASTDCPFGAMPCGGPRLAQADVETIRRWLDGGAPHTHGDPHIRTVDNVGYDFQSAGEFTLLREPGFEVQTRQTPVSTDGPLPAHSHSGLSTCASLNTAVALSVGGHRITYQPRVDSDQPNREGLVLRIDGKIVSYPGPRGITVDGVRIMATTASGGIQVQGPGGTEVVITPLLWEHYQVWFLNVDVNAARATYGLMGTISPQNWLPALSDRNELGARPAALVDRYQQLYVKYANSWRVKKTNALFDYAPGTDTSKYTLSSWPGFQPQSCIVPPNWTWNPQLPRRATIDVARRACAAVVDKGTRAECEADVMITGEPKFANAYLAGERIKLNARPKAVALQNPAQFVEKVGGNVEFTWQPTSDKNQGKLTYMHCLWAQGEKVSRKHCRDMAEGQTSTSADGLKPGQFYYWKVVVDDGQGATVESETRRFQVEGKLESSPK